MSTCDTLIIGAGITGASLAWRLARAGQRAALVAVEPVGDQQQRAGAVAHCALA